MKNLISSDPHGHFLANLFNCFLLRGSVPACIKSNRSILLPKGDTGLDDVNNWRPLTISSVVLRLYTSCLSKRVLETFVLNGRQRGFIDAPGCDENSFLILETLAHAKKNRNPLCVAFLDLAKAFDTVSHKHLVAGLERFETDPHFIRIVQDLYTGASTRLRPKRAPLPTYPSIRV